MRTVHWAPTASPPRSWIWRQRAVRTVQTSGAYLQAPAIRARPAHPWLGETGGDAVVTARPRRAFLLPDSPFAQHRGLRSTGPVGRLRGFSGGAREARGFLSQFLVPVY